MDLGIEGKVALVTGGSRGIGRAIAIGLAQEGAKVIFTYASNKNAADETLAQLAKLQLSAEALSFDVKDPNASKQAVEDVVKRHGGLHILVNNAGVALDNLLLRYKDDDLDQIFRTNVFGPFYLTRAASRAMMKARWGRIINLGSVVGQMGNTGQAAYAATKSALEGLSKSVGRELASRGITANLVAPGFIATEMTEKLSEENKEAMLAQIPLGRMGEAQEVADAVLFLASERAKYVTGQVLAVNGGMYM